jgi:hypothetical protein
MFLVWVYPDFTALSGENPDEKQAIVKIDVSKGQRM